MVNGSKIQSSFSASGLVCPINGPSFGAPTRIVFVEDMSLSNLGGAVADCNPATSQCWWYLGTSGLEGSQTVTDLNALRLKVADDIIDLTAPYQNFSYSTLGFGSSVMLGSPTDSCRSNFTTDPALAHDSVRGLRQIHNADLAVPQPYIGTYYSPPFQMGNTSYDSAINCLKDKIMTDIAQLSENNERPSYQVFFLTDGKATDSVAQCTDLEGTALANCYAQYYAPKLQTLAQQVTLNNATFKFNPVYYGAANEQGDAEIILNAMARAVDPTVSTLVSNNFSAITQNLNTRFQSSGTVSYRIKNFSAVNLTTTFDGSKPSSDSDMDGLSDNFESGRAGFSATNPRSTGAIDRLCYDRTGGSSCSTQGLTCTGVQKYFMLTDCDIEYLYNNSTKPLGAGLDSDKDNIVDYLEIIRGINPKLSNAQSDDDGDSISNIAEVNQGTNPLMNNGVQAPLPTQIINAQVIESNQNNTQCTTQGTHWSWNIPNVPLVNVQAYTDQSTGGLFNFSHAQDENIILVSYVAEPINSSTQPKLVYAAIVKLKLAGGSKAINLDFKLVGAVK